MQCLLGRRKFPLINGFFEYISLCHPKEKSLTFKTQVTNNFSWLDNILANFFLVVLQIFEVYPSLSVSIWVWYKHDEIKTNFCRNFLQNIQSKNNHNWEHTNRNDAKFKLRAFTRTLASHKNYNINCL